MTKEEHLIMESYYQYKDLMLDTALNILKDEEYAQDAVQIASEKILKNKKVFCALHEKKRKRYFLSAVRNTAIDIYRKRDLTAEKEISWDDTIDIPTIEISSPYENELHIALDQLPNIYKEVIDLKYVQGYHVDEIANKLNISETSTKQRLFRARKQLVCILKTFGILVLFITCIIIAGVGIKATIGGELWLSFIETFQTGIITENNQDKIGQETILNSYYIDNKGMYPTIDIMKETKLIHSFKDIKALPVYISDFQIENDHMPSVLLKINTCTVLYQDDYSGWICKKGDTLYFDFEKYEHETRRNQPLVIGYVKEGVMYDGVIFNALSGCYQLKIAEDGEYYIYLLNLDLDNMSIKSGVVKIGTKEEHIK